jgi:hypothetical protein
MGTAAINYDKYTYADYETWDDSERWEIIDGFPYNMSPAPSRIHQRLVTKKDTQEKFVLYERFGVKEYWIVDPDRQTIAVYVFGEPHKYRLDKKYSSTEKLAVVTFPGMEIDLAVLFGA